MMRWKRNRTQHAHFGGLRCDVRPTPTAGRHRDRVYPVLSSFKRSRSTIRRFHGPASVIRSSNELERASKISEALRWIPMRPLDAYAMRVEDARMARLHKL